MLCLHNKKAFKDHLLHTAMFGLLATAGSGCLLKQLERFSLSAHVGYKLLVSPPGPTLPWSKPPRSPWFHLLN